MRKIHPLTALAAFAGIVLTADWCARREASLVHQLVTALGGA